MWSWLYRTSSTWPSTASSCPLLYANSQVRYICCYWEGARGGKRDWGVRFSSQRQILSGFIIFIFELIFSPFLNMYWVFILKWMARVTKLDSYFELLLSSCKPQNNEHLSKNSRWYKKWKIYLLCSATELTWLAKWRCVSDLLSWYQLFVSSHCLVDRFLVSSHCLVHRINNSWHRLQISISTSFRFINLIPRFAWLNVRCL